MSRLYAKVPAMISWPTIVTTLLLAILTGAWMRFDASKVDMVRFVLDSATTQHELADLRRDVHDFGKVLARIDSNTQRR